jgi:magnesium transporter
MEYTPSSMALASPVSSASVSAVTQGFGSDSQATSTFGLLSLLLGTLDGDEDEKHQRWSSFIGIVVAICGNILISFALNMQRYAHVRIEQEAEGERVRMRSRRHLSSSTYGSIDDPYTDEPEYESYEEFESGQHAQGFSDDHETGDSDNTDHSVISDHTLRPHDGDSIHGDRPSYLHSPYWWAGIVLMSLGEMGNFLAYGFAPASIVSPLGVVALISNCMIAPFLLKEKFRARDFWGVVIAVAGAVVVVLSAETSETKIGPHDIWVMITKWEFELYLGLTTALIIALMYSSGKYGSRTILIDLGLVGLFGKL